MSRIVLADSLPSMSTITTKTLKSSKNDLAQTEEIIVESDNTDNANISQNQIPPQTKMIKIRGASNKMRRVKGSLYF